MFRSRASSVPAALMALALAPAAIAVADHATVPRGAIVAVRMDRPLSSDELATGDTFTATVVEPIYIDGKPAIAEGSVVDGVVTVVRTRAQGHRSGVIGMRFVQLHAPDGSRHAIDGALVGFRGDATAERPRAAQRAGGTRAVVVIGSEGDGPGKRPSSLVGDTGEDEATLADRWSHSGLGPEQAEIDAGAELTFELRRALTVERPLTE